MLLLCLLPLLVAGQGDLKRWSNEELEVIRTAEPKDGLPLVLAAKHRADRTRTVCMVTLPINQMGDVEDLTVVDGQVIDSSGEAVDWAEAWMEEGSETTTCGVRIPEKLPVHDEVFGGHFRVSMDFSEGGILGHSGLSTLSAKIHMEDDLLTNVKGSSNGEHIHPRHYDLSLEPDLLSTDSLVSYTGRMQADYRVGADSEGAALSFHIEKLDMVSLAGSIQGEDGTKEELQFTRACFDLQRTVVKLVANHTDFIEGDIITIDTNFKANRKGGGLYKVPCSKGSPKYCWFSQFEATGARSAFPCRDEPDQKATFDIRVARTDGWNTLVNMPLVDSQPIPDKEGWVEDTFATSVIMSTYLVAFAFSELVPVRGERNVSVWGAKEDIEAGFGDYSVDLGARVLDYYGKIFNLEYALPKMDMIQTGPRGGGGGGAMENWGLVTFSGDSLLLDPANTDVEARWRVLEVVSHELGHQWTGNLVTMKWWDQTWLNEAFATILSFHAAETMEPEMDPWARFLVHSTQKVMVEDALPTTWAMSDPVISRSDIGRKFGHITYDKGASVLRMLEAALTRSTFIKGLAAYLADLQFGNAVEEQLFAHFQAAGEEDGVWPQEGVTDLTETMKLWTNQAGLPLVEAVRGENGELVLSQSWYGQPDGEADRMWDIPINWAEVGAAADWEDTMPATWLTEKSTRIEFAVTPDLLLVNKLGTGYYRVNYDANTWSRIIFQLITDHKSIHPLNRASIICDVVSLQRSGHVTQDIMDDVLSYRESETDFAPLLAFHRCAGSDITEDYNKEKDVFERYL